jgi:hypothetical protein
VMHCCYSSSYCCADSAKMHHADGTRPFLQAVLVITHIIAGP